MANKRTKIEGEHDKIAYLAEHSARSDMWDVEGMLQVALKDLKNSETSLENPKKAILIILDDEGGKYDHISYNTGMRPSEIISLLSVAKQFFLKDLD